MKHTNKHILNYKNFKKYKNRKTNMRLKQWLVDILPNEGKPETPVNPDETITGSYNSL